MLLKKLIFDGKIPHIKIIKKILLLIAFLPIATYLFMDFNFREYGELGWNILIAVMLIRPLADVFPALKILRTLVLLRKEFGILSGLLICIHGYSFFAMNNKNIFIEIFNLEYWNFSKIMSWGMIGFILAIILLMTSNKFSMRILKNNWKRVQSLSYILFFAGGVHIAMISNDEVIPAMTPIVIVMTFWLMAKFKITIFNPKKINRKIIENKLK